MTTKQGLYTAALTNLGERKYLTNENAEARRALDNVYDDVISECLHAGSWNFATLFSKIDGDTGAIHYEDTGSVGHGYQYGFVKPSGWIRTHGLSGDAYFSNPLIHYVDEDGIIKSDDRTIYLRYTSSDTGAGLELTAWPRLFARYVELELAARVCLRLTQDDKLEERIELKRDKARRRALNQDAMDEAGVKFKPSGSWTLSRGGRSSGRNDRGLRGRLTGG